MQIALTSTGSVQVFVPARTAIAKLDNRVYLSTRYLHLTPNFL